MDGEQRLFVRNGPPSRLGGGMGRGCRGPDLMMKRLFGEPPFKTKSCSDQTTEPCSYNREGDKGILICRTISNPLMGDTAEMTACINPDESVDRDEYGCCGGSCPAACECPCTHTDGTAGVMIERTNPGDEGEDEDEDEDYEEDNIGMERPARLEGDDCRGGRSGRYVPVANALSVVASARATCVITCPED